MAMLRSTTIARFTELLSQSRYSDANFKAEFNLSSGPNTVLVKIGFIPKPAFRFVVEDFNVEETPFRSTEAPGEDLLSAEEYWCRSVDECVRRLDRWLDRIDEEMKSQDPLIKELAEFADAVDAQVKAHIGDEEAHFTREEADRLSQRLDRFADELAKMVERLDMTELELVKVKSDLSALKQDLTRLPKATWYRAAAGKVGSTFKSIVGSPEARQLLLETAKKFLLGN